MINAAEETMTLHICFPHLQVSERRRVAADETPSAGWHHRRRPAQVCVCVCVFVGSSSWKSEHETGQTAATPAACCLPACCLSVCL